MIANFTTAHFKLSTTHVIDKLSYLGEKGSRSEVSLKYQLKATISNFYTIGIYLISVENFYIFDNYYILIETFFLHIWYLFHLYWKLLHIWYLSDFYWKLFHIWYLFDFYWKLVHLWYLFEVSVDKTIMSTKIKCSSTLQINSGRKGKSNIVLK